MRPQVLNDGCHNWRNSQNLIIESVQLGLLATLYNHMPWKRYRTRENRWKDIKVGCLCFFRLRMLEKPNQFYRFDPYRVDISGRRLMKEGERIKLTPKAFEALLLLLEKRGTVVRKETLIKHVWRDDSTKDDADLATVIAAIRKALGDTGEEQCYVVTLPGHGYMFVASEVVYGREGLSASMIALARAVSSNPLLIVAAVAGIGLLVLVVRDSGNRLFVRVPQQFAMPPPMFFAYSSITMLLLISTALFAEKLYRATAGGRSVHLARTVRILAWTTAVIVGGWLYHTWRSTSEEIPTSCYAMKPGGLWDHYSFSPQTSPFLVEFETVPQQDRLDAVFALSRGPGAAYRDFACLARLSVRGVVQAFDGGIDNYRALSFITYRKGETYRFRFSVNPVRHVYSVYVTIRDGQEYMIARDFAFRKPQDNAALLDDFGTRMDFTEFDNRNTSVRVCNIHVYPF